MFTLEKALELSMKQDYEALEAYIKEGVAEKTARECGNKKPYDIMVKWVKATIKDRPNRPYLHGMVKTGDTWSFCDGYSAVELYQPMNLPIVSGENTVNIKKIIDDFMKNNFVPIPDFDYAAAAMQKKQAEVQQKILLSAAKTQKERKYMPLNELYSIKIHKSYYNVLYVNRVLDVLGAKDLEVYSGEMNEPLIVTSSIGRGLILAVKYNPEVEG
jgi:hypothetical protein